MNLTAVPSQRFYELNTGLNLIQKSSIFFAEKLQNNRKFRHPPNTKITHLPN